MKQTIFPNPFSALHSQRKKPLAMKCTLKYIIVVLICFVLFFQIGIRFAYASGNSFEIHFIDVGQADAAVIICDNEVLMIDGGNSEDSDLIYSYLKNTLKLSHIDYMIATHPHEDHIGGLSAALNACSVGIIYSPVTDYDSKAFRSFKKYALLQGLDFVIPNVGDSFSLGSATVRFLSPYIEYPSMNDNSIVVRIIYGETSFLFTSDAEWDAEHDMVDSHFCLRADLIKVGHHGSNNSSSYVFLREVMPKYAVISVGKNNTYGHPSEDVLSRLQDADTEVYRTDIHGDIICTSDGQTLTFITEKHPPKHTDPCYLPKLRADNMLVDFSHGNAI